MEPRVSGVAVQIVPTSGEVRRTPRKRLVPAMRRLSRAVLDAPVNLLVGLALLGVGAAGCYGDGQGYQVVVDNRSGLDLVVVLDGRWTGDSTTDAVINPAFASPTGSEGAATDWVEAPWSEGGHWRPLAHVYGPGCASMADIELPLGPSVLVVEPESIRVGDYAASLIPPDTAILARVPLSCP
jgi:hypothetical protein